jgi:hypothetical protein
MNVVMIVEMNVVTVVLFYMFAAKPVENINVTNVNTGCYWTSNLSDCMPYMVIAWYERRDFRFLSHKQVVLAITSEKYTQNTAS